MKHENYFDSSKRSHSNDLKRQQARSFNRKARDVEYREKFVLLQEQEWKAKLAHADQILHQAELEGDKIQLKLDAIRNDLEHRERALLVKELLLEVQAREMLVEARELIIYFLAKLSLAEEKMTTMIVEKGVRTAQLNQLEAVVDMIKLKNEADSTEMRVREQLIDVQRRENNAINLLKKQELVAHEVSIDKKILADREDRMNHLQEIRNEAFNAKRDRVYQQFEHEKHEHHTSMNHRENLATIQEKMNSLQERYVAVQGESEKARIEKEYSRLLKQETQFERERISFEGENQRTQLESIASQYRLGFANERDSLSRDRNGLHELGMQTMFDALSGSLRERESSLDARRFRDEGRRHYDKASLAHERSQYETQSASLFKRESNLEREAARQEKESAQSSNETYYARQRAEQLDQLFRESQRDNQGLQQALRDEKKWK
jgi:hypothetical protein